MGYPILGCFLDVILGQLGVIMRHRYAIELTFSSVHHKSGTTNCTIGTGNLRRTSKARSKAASPGNLGAAPYRGDDELWHHLLQAQKTQATTPKHAPSTCNTQYSVTLGCTRTPPSDSHTNAIQISHHPSTTNMDCTICDRSLIEPRTFHPSPNSRYTETLAFTRAEKGI